MRYAPIKVFSPKLRAIQPLNWALGCGFLPVTKEMTFQNLVSVTNKKIFSSLPSPPFHLRISNRGTNDDKDSHVHERLLRSDVPLRWKRNLYQQFHIAILMLETAVKYSAFHSGLCLIINDTPLLPQPPTDGGRVQTFSKVAYWIRKCISMWQFANLYL